MDYSYDHDNHQNKNMGFHWVESLLFLLGLIFVRALAMIYISNLNKTILIYAVLVVVLANFQHAKCPGRPAGQVNYPYYILWHLKPGEKRIFEEINSLDRYVYVVYCYEKFQKF